MRKSTEKVIPKKSGRPATGRDPVMSLRMPPEVRAKVESWKNAQNEKLSLSKAIIRLVMRGLAGESAHRRAFSLQRSEALRGKRCRPM
jgi:hypothetical protein